MSLENTVRIMQMIERTHRNLGLPTVFAKMIDLANMGMFLIGPRGTGKTRVMDAIIQLRHRDILEISRLTPAGLKRIADMLSDSEVTIVNPDFSSFYSDYIRDAGLNVMAHLLTEHRVPKSWTAQYKYEVTNCTISFLSTAQPQLLRKINSIPQWESMYRDRFIRFCLLYPFGTPDWTDKKPTVPEITMAGPNILIPSEIKKMPEYERIRRILSMQTSQGRSELYLNRLLKAHAQLNNRDTVIKADVEMLNLFSLYLVIDPLLSTRETVSSPLKFNPDAYMLLFFMIEHKEATRKQMKEYFRLKREKGIFSALSRAIEPLMALNILKGSYGSPKYKLNPRFKQKYIDPILKFKEEYL